MGGGHFSLIPTGKTIWDEESRVSGALEVPLAEGENREFESTLKKVQILSIDRLFCGPTRSARETGDRISQKLHLSLTLVENLSELNLGVWQGMLESEIRVRYHRAYQIWKQLPSHVYPPLGENLQECQQRLIQSLRRIFRSCRGEFRIGFVLPPYAKTLLDLHLQQKPLDSLFQLLYEEKNITSYRSYLI
ncbi:MAG: histidine phosphatase family protein [Planctomycetota bacterium]